MLEALGVNIDLSPEAACRMIEDIGIAFLYAPLFHPVNVQGPSPGDGTRHQNHLLHHHRSADQPCLRFAAHFGVYKPELLDTVTSVARDLGYTDALFVHGLDGLDEISLMGRTRINELRNGNVRTYEITPEDFGLSRCTLEDIKTGTPEENAACIRGVFAGKISGPQRDAILLNAAGALMIGERAGSFQEGIELARTLIDSGAAARKLSELSEASHSYKE